MTFCYLRILLQTRILFVVRSRPNTALRGQRYSGASGNHVIVMTANGSEIHRVVTWSYSHLKGSHPTWSPNGHEVIMNLQFPTKDDSWRKVACPTLFSGVDSEGFPTKGRSSITTRELDVPLGCRVLGPCGTGHPTAIGIEPEGDTGLFLTDAYAKESGVFRGLVKTGAVPLRLTLPKRNEVKDQDKKYLREVELLQVMVTAGDRFGGTWSNSRNSMAWRCDMHPSFNRNFTWIAFNARPGELPCYHLLPHQFE